jgi:hypothetical protein
MIKGAGGKGSRHRECAWSGGYRNGCGVRRLYIGSKSEMVVGDYEQENNDGCLAFGVSEADPRG